MEGIASYIPKHLEFSLKKNEDLKYMPVRYSWERLLTYLTYSPCVPPCLKVFHWDENSQRQGRDE